MLFLFLFVIFINCDIPVHCEYKDVHGTWTFHFTEKVYGKGVVKNECDMQSTIVPDFSRTFHLSEPNLAESDGYIGTWTMVVDQGLEITIQNHKYFAFFVYESSANDVNFTSDCSKTFTGTYHRDVVNPQHWGCFYGEKVSSNAKALKKSYPSSWFGESREVFENDEFIVNKVNSDPEKTWTAKVYPEMEGKVMAMGVKHHPSLRYESIQNHMNYMKAQRYNMNRISKTPNLPEQFIWNNVSGVDYVSPVRAQLMCGSCYAFSTMGMFEARERIYTSMKNTPIFSPQDIVDCNPYSQGCDGGMPILVAKYGKDFGIMEEKCDAYAGETGKCVDQSCPYRSFVYEYDYVGGYYGASNEENIMQAIYERGPVAIAFAVFPDLKQYHGGIYTCPKNGDMEAEYGTAPTPKYYPADHAVLIVGWGVLNGEKYWLVKNSWGLEWGVDGYFMIKKGVNECNIEALIVSAEVISGEMVNMS